jgi:hypothetical protein
VQLFGDPINGNCSSDFQEWDYSFRKCCYADFTDGSGIKWHFNHYVATNRIGMVAMKYKLDNGAWTILPTNAFVNGYNDLISPAGQGNILCKDKTHLQEQMVVRTGEVGEPVL